MMISDPDLYLDPTGQVILDSDLDPDNQKVSDPGGSRSATLIKRLDF